MIEWCRRVRESIGFQNAVVTAIMLSVLMVGLEGYPGLRERYGQVLILVENLALGFFVVELLIRITAFAPRPWRFFKSPWNVFDFVIVAACFLPSSQFAVVLRMARILRVMRLGTTRQQAEIRHLKHVELSAAYRKLDDAYGRLEDAYRQLDAEKARSERLLLNILPQLIAQRLKTRQDIIADSFPDVSVMFADIVGFTRMSGEVSAETMVARLDKVFSRFDRLAEHYGVEKIKTIGDAYMAVSGVPRPRDDHLQALARMALDMYRELDSFNGEEGLELAIRVGIHAGPVVAGVIGKRKFIYDLWGDTVNIASRMESTGVPGRIQLPAATAARLDADFRLEPRGPVAVKGKGEITTCFLVAYRE